MARKVTIGGGGASGEEHLFAGEDKTIAVEVLDAALVPVNISSFAGALYVRRLAGDTGTLLITPAPTWTVTGTYNADRDTNTQRATFTLTDTQTLALGAGNFQHATKRTDDGSETVITYGPFIVEDSAAD